MPSLSSPRKVVVCISAPPGRVAPSSATGTRSPTCWFCAPVTICSRRLPPTSTWQVHMWSLSWWRTISTILPTTTLEMPSPM